jgi:hypothetical protein
MDFERDIEPILREHCFSCHGPQKQKSGFRLDLHDAAMRGGDSGTAPIVAGKSAESPLIGFVARLDAAMLMPPADSGKAKLTANEVSLLRAWIDQGAKWSESKTKKDDSKNWWSLAPLTRHAPPSSGHPIDAFVREATGKGPIAGAGGRSPHAHPAGVFGSSRPAADAARGGWVYRGRGPQSLREARGQAADVAALRRALGPALARSR